LQTCSRCQTRSSDVQNICPNCQASLKDFSTFAIALSKFLDNPRVIAIRISAPKNACPACNQIGGAYSKEFVPSLPIQGCSEDGGCRCFYEPVLEENLPVNGWRSHE
jgi:hypothetical protein